LIGEISKEWCIDMDSLHLSGISNGGMFAWYLASTATDALGNFSDTGRMYIKGYLYPILYPKISKKDISYPFLEQDILRI
jgi:hypothetical protein